MGPIKKLTLVFPHGAALKEIETLVQSVSPIVGAGISRGGFEMLNGDMWSIDKIEWSTDSLCYVFDYDRRNGNKITNIPNTSGCVNNKEK